MYHLIFTNAVVYALFGKAVAHFPQPTKTSNNFHKAEAGPPDFGLLRRQLDPSLTSGTITITVAPDNTCGFEFGEPFWTCNYGRRCSWESGRINRFFCGWDDIHTSCLDSTVVLNTDKCDVACYSNTNNGRCTLSEYPRCAGIDLGHGILQYICTNTSTEVTIDSTLSLDDRKFSTFILVDGHAVSSTTSSSTTITSTAPPTATTHHSDTNVGAIVGGVVGGVAALGLLVGGVVGAIILRRRKRKRTMPPDSNHGSAPQGQVAAVIPSQNNIMASPAQADGDGLNMNSQMKSRGQMSPYSNISSPPMYQSTQSPPVIYEAPSPDATPVFEMNGERADHHRGSIQELY